MTGSRFLIDTPRARVLVECGLYQGLKDLRLRNWAPFPVPPRSIDAVVLTHAHVDHCGYLPALWRQGFRGRIYATHRTKQLCQIVLPDAGRLQEEEAAYANRKGYSKHKPALSLFTEDDAHAVLRRFRGVDYEAREAVADGVAATFSHAGHILGSAVVSVTVEGRSARRVVFSGDLGRPDHPLLRPPEPIGEADALLVESTYGDREHPREDGVDLTAAAIARTAARGGVVVIPAFAVDRTEVVLFYLTRLMREGRLPQLPLYADSPMALAALRVYRSAIDARDSEIRPELLGGSDPFDPGNLVEAHRPEESKAINRVRGPAIVVSASGMATGGRVLHHLAQRLPDARNCVILGGFQAQGTRGRRLLEGAHAVKMLGRYVPVRAEIVDGSAFSVHADREETIEWLGRAKTPPGVTYVVHGEADAAASLRGAVEERLGWNVVVPGFEERVRIDPSPEPVSAE